MLRVILNRLEAKADELLAEEQAGFRPDQSRVEQSVNSLVIIEKPYKPAQSVAQLHRLQGVWAFDQVWHVGLWQVLICVNIDEGLV